MLSTRESSKLPHSPHCLYTVCTTYYRKDSDSLAHRICLSRKTRCMHRESLVAKYTGMRYKVNAHARVCRMPNVSPIVSASTAFDVPHVEKECPRGNAPLPAT